MEKLLEELRKLIEEVGDAENVSTIIDTRKYRLLKEYLEKLLNNMNKRNEKFCYASIIHFSVAPDDINIKVYEQYITHYEYNEYSLKQILRDAIECKKAKERAEKILDELERLLI